MKRLFALFLALTVCCVLFAACGGTQKPAAEAPAPTGAPAVAEAPKPTDAPAPTEAPKPTNAPAPTEAPAEEASGAALPDGVYQASFKTDSSMFHVNEAHKGMGVLTVKDGQMTIHVTLASKKITLLYAGSAEDAKASETHIEPTVDSVTYDDGTSEEAFGFDIPVPAVGEEFPCALFGSKGKWYDHMVSVSDPIPIDEVG